MPLYSRIIAQFLAFLQPVTLNKSQGHLNFGQSAEFNGTYKARFKRNKSMSIR